ncbi:2-phospho-L-lactate guanylyltransferase [Streptomyces spiralis]|uniref:2-phospho-L-lactate guanylyltransferase n=1 Tax=Streptomyces spiralis TaxID=66376 RepID=UPI003401F7DE
MTGAWQVVMPVKPFAVAKSRLGGWAGCRRAALARSFFLDTLSVALGTDGVARVIVVTEDPEARADALSMGALAVDDRPRTGLNTAALRGVACARSLDLGAPVAVLAADLPALRRTELSHVLALARHYPRAFLADHTGHGTTVLTAGRAQALRPAFEGASRHNHRLSGAHEITSSSCPSVRLDVDTADDLRAAERLGVGQHTSRTIPSSPSAAAIL